MKVQKQGLDGTTITAEAKYPIVFTGSGKRFLTSLYYNGSNSFLFVNAAKMWDFKAKNSEINSYTLNIGNISKPFTLSGMKKTGLKASIKFYFVIYNAINTSNILDIYRYLMKEKWY